jgi:hypothetical protein
VAGQRPPHMTIGPFSRLCAPPTARPRAPRWPVTSARPARCSPSTWLATDLTVADGVFTRWPG